MTLPIFRLLLAAVALLAAAPGARAQTPEIRVGQRIGGMLATGDSIDLVGVGAYLVDELRFSGRAGQRVTVTLHSAAFDAYLRVGRRVDGRFVRLATDDDGAGGRGARVVLTLPEAGEYRIVVTSARPREAGAYTLALAAGAPAGERGRP